MDLSARFRFPERAVCEILFHDTNSMEQSPPSEVINAQLVKKCPVFCETWRFITVFIKATIGPYSEPDEANLHPQILFP